MFLRVWADSILRRLVWDANVFSRLRSIPSFVNCTNRILGYSRKVTFERLIPVISPRTTYCAQDFPVSRSQRRVHNLGGRTLCGVLSYLPLETSICFVYWNSLS